MRMSIQIVFEKTPPNVVNNGNLQKFCMVLATAYPILHSCTVPGLVIEWYWPAYALSRSDVKIFTLFVNSRKHFVQPPGLCLCAFLTAHSPPPPPIPRWQCLAVLLAFLGGKAYCSRTGWGSHTWLRKGDSALTPRIAQKDAILHLTRIVPTKGSWPTCFFADCARPQP